MLNTAGNRVSYFGHSTFSLTTPSGQVALIDPWVMTNPVCPDKLKKVPKLDVIFLSHGHSDHLGDLLTLAKQHNPQIVLFRERQQIPEVIRVPVRKKNHIQLGDFLQFVWTHR